MGERPRAGEGVACPRCGRRRIRDDDDWWCLVCGTIQEPRTVAEVPLVGHGAHHSTEFTEAERRRRKSRHMNLSRRLKA